MAGAAFLMTFVWVGLPQPASTPSILWPSMVAVALTGTEAPGDIGPILLGNGPIGMGMSAVVILPIRGMACWAAIRYYGKAV